MVEKGNKVISSENRDKRIGKTLYVVNSIYSGNNKLSDLLFKAMDREAECTSEI